MHSIRHRITRAQRNGFGYRFSQSKEDFDYFYHQMYLPYVKARHGHLAKVAPYHEQWRRWFRRGGLLLVTQHARVVAGNLCYLAGDTVYSMEAGVLNSDPLLIQQGISALIDWYTFVWAHQHGAATVNMGGSHAWRMDGVFSYKQRWRSKVIRRRAIYANWTFLANALPASLQDTLNQIGFIGEMNDRFYAILVESDRSVFNIETEAAKAVQQGLAGIAVIGPQKQSVYDAAYRAARVEESTARPGALQISMEDSR
jgi:hypothetical protein